MPFHIFVETAIHFFQDDLLNRKFKNIICCNIINVFTVTLYQFNAVLLNKSITFFKKKIPKKRKTVYASQSMTALACNRRQ